METNDLRSHRSAGTRQLAAVALISVMVTVMVMGVIFAQPNSFSRDTSAESSLEAVDQYETLEETWEIIHAAYVDTEAIDDSALLYGATEGMVEALGDFGHSRFLDPEETEDFASLQRGKLIGIGVQLDLTGGEPTVVMTIHGSPAEAAGVLPGDVLKEVDGVSTAGLEMEQVSGLLRGDEGTPVSVSIWRANDASSHTVELIRAEIELDPLEVIQLPNGISLIRINEFSAGVSDQLEDALATGAGAGLEGIVLDLRDNPGGYLDEAIDVASLFLPEGSIVLQTEDRSGEVESTETRETGPEGKSVPMVALINGNSASAAEIVAAALQANGRAVLIGEKTYGTGTVLTPFGLEDGSSVLVGTSQWLTPDGEVVWREGIEADVVIELSSPLDTLRPADATSLSVEELVSSSDEQLKRGFEMTVALVQESGSGDAAANGAVAQLPQSMF